MLQGLDEPALQAHQRMMSVVKSDVSSSFTQPPGRTLEFGCFPFPIMDQMQDNSSVFAGQKDSK